jgi:hypothetical protein
MTQTLSHLADYFAEQKNYLAQNILIELDVNNVSTEEVKTLCEDILKALNNNK